MNPLTVVRREVVAYLALTYALATAIVVVLPHAGINALLSVLVPTVTVTVLTFTLVPRGRRRALWGTFGLQRSGRATWLSATLVPVVLCAGAYAVAVLVGAGRLQVDPTDADLAWVVDLVVSLVVGTAFILGEEIGWRGFLLPRVQQLVPDKRRAALLTGFAHGCFHLPLILIGTTYDNQVPGWVAAPTAVALITAGGVFYAWIWDRSRSVWAVSIAHNTVNTVFDLGAAAVVATGGANVAYIAGETGVATLGVVVVLAVLLLRYARVWRTSTSTSERRPTAVAAA